MRTNAEYLAGIERNLSGPNRRFASTGICPGCETCMDDYGRGMSAMQFKEAWSNCQIESEPFFSWRQCDACGSYLGGNRDHLHWVDEDGAIGHGCACTDCVMFLANGDLPNDEA